jgi:maleate cis-trans isomerase
MLLPANATLLVSRTGGYDVNVIPDSDEMRRFVRLSLDQQIQLLVDARVDIIAYGCTSATLSDGPEFDRQFSQLIEQKSSLPAVTTAGALVDAIRAMAIKRVAFTSPYIKKLADESVDFLTNSGIQVVNQLEFKRELNSLEQGALTPQDAYQMALKADVEEAQAIVISCTDYRALEALPFIEKTLGKPVICSNQALMYSCLKQLNLSPVDPLLGGSLFKQGLSTSHSALTGELSR